MLAYVPVLKNNDLIRKCNSMYKKMKSFLQDSLSEGAVMEGSDCSRCCCMCSTHDGVFTEEWSELHPPGSLTVSSIIQQKATLTSKDRLCEKLPNLT